MEVPSSPQSLGHLQRFAHYHQSISKSFNDDFFKCPFRSTYDRGERLRSDGGLFLAEPSETVDILDGVETDGADGASAG